jgi:outer membrane receptor protein involved in Fe transport
MREIKAKNFAALIITVFIFLIAPFAYGQENKTYSISGKLIDSINNQPIDLASVAVYKLRDTVLITGTITNAKGEFVLGKISSGKYILKSSFVGYYNNSIIIEIKNESLSLSKPIYMIASSLHLNEVRVTSSRKEKLITIEKTKINVSQNMAAVSGNLTDVLKSQSSVSIDAENNVYLRGNKNILILLDGVPTTISALNSIPSSSVESVEIITNPDAKYDAEGTGGIINVITKRQNISGLSGTTTLNYGFNNRINGGLNLNYSKSIWDLGFTYNGKYEKLGIESNLTRYLYTKNVFVEQEIKSIQTSSTHTAALFLSAKPNKKEIITMGVKLVTPEITNNQIITGSQIYDTLPYISFNRENEIVFSRRTFEGLLSYKKAFEKNKNEISFDASFSRTKGSRPADYYIENHLLQKSSGGGAPTNITVQTDYLKSLFKAAKIECGLKGFSRWNNFNYNFYDLDTISKQWNLNPAFSNDLEHHEYIYASYAMYSDSLFKKIFLKIGGRVEYNTSELFQKSIGQKIYKDYLFPFPYLLLKHNIDRTQSVALGINRRITRPTYPQLNPFINVIDHMTYETGNKNLEPEVLDKVELNYSLTKEKFQFKTNLFFSVTKDFITQVSMLSATDNLILTYVNGVRQNRMGGDFDVVYKLSNHISINPGFSIFQTRSTGRYNEIDLSTNNMAWTGNLKTVIRPEQKTELQLFLNYNSPVALPQFNLSEINYVDIAVRRTFFNNTFSANLTFTDIFNTRNWRIQSDNAIYKLNNYSKSETRVFWIALTYNFNSFKSSRSQKNGDNEDDGGVIKLGQ